MLANELAGIETIFLDRDGTINVKAASGRYITSPAEVELLPGAAKAVAALNAAGLRTVLVTNQRWLSVASANLDRYAAVHNRMAQLLAHEGAWLDAVYFCPHEAGVCDCRKPGIGMLVQAARDHDLDLSCSVMIGDSETDVMAGQAAGTATILLRNSAEEPSSANAVVEDLEAAVRLILASRTNVVNRV
jgi:D-glycero-D-manno-heptose 1,7-bisphosphate phosphatase